MIFSRHIPNTITCCNLISGCIATGCAFHGQFLWAVIWIVAGAVFDFFDGMSARALGVSSPIGKELAFSALRLAKFNLDERQTMGFIGLPTPANALFWGSLVLGQHAFLVSLKFNAVFLFLFMLLFCMLLVSEVPMLALKFKDLSWEHNKVKYIFLLGCLPCFLLGASCFAAIIVWYVALSIIVKR